MKNNLKTTLRALKSSDVLRNGPLAPPPPLLENPLYIQIVNYAYIVCNNNKISKANLIINGY